MSLQFYDHFAESNKDLQERLGSAPNEINKLSAILGNQTRSLLQMLAYGNDSITARAASHLLNMDALYSSDAYLMKLTEGILLNSIKSVTPPRLSMDAPLEFTSTRAYGMYSTAGSVKLTDGTSSNLVIYALDDLTPFTSSEYHYKAWYCAGAYVHQDVSASNIDLSVGTFTPIYVPAKYKTIWGESVKAEVHLVDGSAIPLTLYESMPDLLAATDMSDAALCQHTPRGLTITLGDGELFGSKYAVEGSKGNVREVRISYIACESLADADPATLKLNADIISLSAVPLLSKSMTGDTPESLRSRAIGEFFASGKITDENDLVVELLKIPYVKSCAARREYNYPWPTLALSDDGRLNYIAGSVYQMGSIVRYKNADGADKIYIRTSKEPAAGDPINTAGWTELCDASVLPALARMCQSYPSACVYDNATIVVSGLVMPSRRYWTDTEIYSTGVVVYHMPTKSLYIARQPVAGVEPGSEDAIEYWIPETAASKGDWYIGDYVPMTQAMFEAEFKGYFGIWRKLGFTSVIVEPLEEVPVTVTCAYYAPYDIAQDLQESIAKYICFEVGKDLRAADLNAMLAEKFSLASVYTHVALEEGGSMGDHVQLGSRQYVDRKHLTITISEISNG